MLRTNQIILIILIILAVGGLGGYLWYKKINAEQVSPSQAIPASAIAIYQGKDYHDAEIALFRTGIFNGFGEKFGVFQSRFHRLDSIISSDEEFSTILKEDPPVISAHAVSSSALDLLYILEVKRHINNAGFQKYINEHWANTQFVKHIYQNTDVYEAKNGGQKLQFTYTFTNGLLLISQTGILVEDAIDAVQNRKKLNAELVQAIDQSRQENRFFINYKRISDLADQYSNVNSKPLNALASFGNYSYLIDKENIRLNGNLKTSAADYLNVFNKQSAKQITSGDVMSSSSAFTVHFTFTSFNDYYTAYMGYLKANDSLNEYVSARDKSLTDQGLRLEDITSLVSDEWAYSLPEAASESEKNDPLLYLKVADTAAALNKFKALNERVTSRSMQSAKGENYHGQTINQSAFEDIFGYVFGGFVSSLSKPYYTAIGNYIVLSNDIEKLKVVIDDYAKGEVLSKSSGWVAAFGSNRNGNLRAYLNPSAAMIAGLQYCREDFVETFRSNFAAYGNIKGVGYDLTSNGGNLENTIMFLGENAASQTLDKSWTAHLEATTALPVFAFKNQTGDVELYVQDATNKLYKISSGGAIEWQRQIDALIVGKIEQVDLFHNGTKQLLFAAGSNVYMLDGDGNAIGSYPIGLAGQALSGVVLQKNAANQYVYYVATEGRIYGFDLSGKPVQGWSPQTTNGNVQIGPGTFTFKGKNFLYAYTDKHELTIWDESGKKAVQPFMVPSKITNPFMFVNGSAATEAYLVSVDTAGMVYKLYLDGKVSYLNYNTGLNNPFAVYSDVDNDGREDLIMAGDRKIIVYRKDTAKIWQMNLISPLSSAPQILRLKEKLYAVYYNETEGKLYMQSVDGLLYHGFPVAGQSNPLIVDINNDQIPDLVAPDSNGNINLYRLTQ